MKSGSILEDASARRGRGSPSAMTDSSYCSKAPPKDDGMSQSAIGGAQKAVRSRQRVSKRLHEHELNTSCPSTEAHRHDHPSRR